MAKSEIDSILGSGVEHHLRRYGKQGAHFADSVSKLIEELSAEQVEEAKPLIVFYFRNRIALWMVEEAQERLKIGEADTIPEALAMVSPELQSLIEAVYRCTHSERAERSALRKVGNLVQKYLS